MVIEHFCKGAEDSGLVLVEGTLNVDVEQDGFRRDRHALDRLGIHHRVIEFVFEVVDGWNSLYLLVREQVGEHLQEV